MVRCSRCNRILTHPESIIRGMGPICFGKTYVYRKLMKEGRTRREILEIPEDQILIWAKEEVKKYQNEHKEIKVSKKPKKVHLKTNGNIKHYKKDPNQMNLDSFFVNTSNELDDLKVELRELTNTASKSNNNDNLDRALELMDKIKELEVK